MQTAKRNLDAGPDLRVGVPEEARQAIHDYVKKLMCRAGQYNRWR